MMPFHFVASLLIIWIRSLFAMVWYIAGILYENKILPTNNVVEVDRSGPVSQYFGATAEKTSCVINAAMGGVLFIDEAYALANNSDTVGITDYGKEAIDTLVKAMEDCRGRFCVILAGYKNEMLKMLSANPGFASRIQFTLEFPDYTGEELGEIAKAFLAKKKYTTESSALERLPDITEYYRNQPNFANARTVRNVLDQVLMNQNLRTEDLEEDNTVIAADVEEYIPDEGIVLSDADMGKRTIGFV